MAFMDLLFTEYASPFLLLDGVISTGQFCEFLSTFEKKHQERQRWEYYIHKMSLSDMSWEEFNRKLDVEQTIQTRPRTPRKQIQKTVDMSKNILSNWEGGAIGK